MSPNTERLGAIERLDGLSARLFAERLDGLSARLYFSMAVYICLHTIISMLSWDAAVHSPGWALPLFSNSAVFMTIQIYNGLYNNLGKYNGSKDEKPPQ